MPFLGELGCQNMGRWGYCRVCGAGGVGRAGHRRVGPRVGAAGRAALVPCRHRFWVQGGGLGVGPSWCWVTLGARTSCLSAGSGSRRSSYLFARSASRLLVLPRVSSLRCAASRGVAEWWSPFMF